MTLAALALLLLVVGPRSRVDLPAEVWLVPPGESRRFDVALKQKAGVLYLNCRVLTPQAKVRVAVIRKPSQIIAQTTVEHVASFRYALPGLGIYTVQVRNEEQRREVRVQVTASIAFGIRELSPARRTLVVVLSLATFALLACFAWRRLRGAIRL